MLQRNHAQPGERQPVDTSAVWTDLIHEEFRKDQADSSCLRVRFANLASSVDGTHLTRRNASTTK